MGKDHRLDLLQGTLDLLILRTLEKGPKHGWDIAERIEQISERVLEVNQGSLYPALHRLEHQGWIRAEWGVSDLGRRARFHRLTNAGSKRLQRETMSLRWVAASISRVLEMAWICPGMTSVSGLARFASGSAWSPSSAKKLPAPRAH